ncbi:MAG: phytanoyl-CoA dioxygenase family protein [Abditibacteriaceae bacterium]
MNSSQHTTALYEKGFTVLPAFYDAADCQDMREIMDDYWKSQGSPSLQQNDFGFAIHPMLPQVPEIAKYLDASEPLEILSEALRQEARLMHVGARISGSQSAPRIGWHNHYSWGEGNLPKRNRLERILTAVYVDGTTPESGSLIALPRQFNDPQGDCPNEGEHPDEIKVNAPAGSVVIFDTALWHDAERGTGNGIRRLWGTHFQGWSDCRTHPEDNEVDTPKISSFKNHLPRLKAIVEREDREQH